MDIFKLTVRKKGKIVQKRLWISNTLDYEKVFIIRDLAPPYFTNDSLFRVWVEITEHPLPGPRTMVTQITSRGRHFTIFDFFKEIKEIFEVAHPEDDMAITKGPDKRFAIIPTARVKHVEASFGYRWELEKVRIKMFFLFFSIFRMFCSL